MQPRFDVVVVGCGPAGSSTAYHLARRGWKTLVVERGKFPRDKACGDGLTPPSVRLLDEMGVDLAELPHRKITGAALNMGGTSMRRELVGCNGRAPYAAVVARRELDARLAKAATDAGATLWENTTAIGVRYEHGRIASVEMSGEPRSGAVSTRFVVAADGAAAAFARRVGLPQADCEVSGFAIRGYFDVPQDMADRFEIHVPINHPSMPRILPGYGWIFPMEGRLANVGVGYFMARTSDRSINLRSLMNEFITQISRQRRLSRAGKDIGGAFRCAVSANTAVGPGIIRVGDAAGLIDPFSGEGIDAALMSGKLAAETLNEALSSPSHAQLCVLEGYVVALDKAYRHRFVAAGAFLKSYMFTWKVLQSPANLRRPVFDRLRDTVFSYGLGESASSIRFEEPLLRAPDPVLSRRLSQTQSRISDVICEVFPSLLRTSLDLLAAHPSALRSAMLLSRAAPETREGQCIEAAAALELAYLAGLFYDDVSRPPESDLAEKAAPATDVASWGNRLCLMFGDYLLARAYAMLAAIDVELSAMTARTSEEVARLDLKRSLVQSPWLLDEEERARLFTGRTGLYFSLACCVSEHLFGSGYSWAAVFGSDLGQGIQLLQDLDDVTLPFGAAGGHPIACRSAAGPMPYPVLEGLACGSLSPETVMKPSIAADEIQKIQSDLASCGGLQRTRKRAKFKIAAALRCLSIHADEATRAAWAPLSEPFLVD